MDMADCFQLSFLSETSQKVLLPPLQMSSMGSRTWVQKKVPEQPNPDDRNPLARLRRKPNAMPVTGYDAAAIEDFYDRRPLQVGWRLNSLGFPLLGKLSMILWMVL